VVRPKNNAFCRENKLTRSIFDRWRRILSALPREQSKPKALLPSPFVPLRVVANPMAEVLLRSGIVVRLPMSTTPETVTRLVTSVVASTC
ncbi:MAG TPA: hypothetical protein VGJ05_02500, partial [Fimbriiglobus sp.]